MSSIYDMSEKNGLILHAAGCEVLLSECERIYNKLKKRIARGKKREKRSLLKFSLTEALMKYAMLTDMDILRIISAGNISKYLKKGKKHWKNP